MWLHSGAKSMTDNRVCLEVRIDSCSLPLIFVHLLPVGVAGMLVADGGGKEFDKAPSGAFAGVRDQCREASRQRDGGGFRVAIVVVILPHLLPCGLALHNVLYVPYPSHAQQGEYTGHGVLPVLVAMRCDRTYLMSKRPSVSPLSVNSKTNSSSRQSTASAVSPLSLPSWPTVDQRVAHLGVPSKTIHAGRRPRVHRNHPSSQR